MLGLATLDFGVVPWGAASVVRFWALVGAYPSIAVLLNPLNRQWSIKKPRDFSFENDYM